VFHEIIVELTVGSMDVMPITKFNTVFDADHINSLFARQVSAIIFFAQGWDYVFRECIWGEVLCVPSRRGHAVRFVFAVLLAVTSTVANAQTRIGTANSVQPEASGSVAGTLSAGSGVHANETVKTGSSGKAGLQFNDQSNLSVGPSSQVRLDKFAYDPNKGTGSTVIEATRGTFRFTTGPQNGGQVKIKTPYGTLGTRG
jgi:hypothetical protein